MISCDVQFIAVSILPDQTGISWRSRITKSSFTRNRLLNLKQMLPYFRTKISGLRHREVPTKYIASRFLHSSIVTVSRMHRLNELPMNHLDFSSLKKCVSLSQ